MKTAVSLPDDVFRAAEAQARRTKKSRSQLYAEALAEYLARHAPDEVTEAMNRVLERVKEPKDPFVSAAARRILERSEW
jgi:metal-responsive CopG/Arc/MetJ family transcriptional regulator